MLVVNRNRNALVSSIPTVFGMNRCKATKDYSSRLGDREIYQEYFRRAFANAYADGYSGQ